MAEATTHQHADRIAAPPLEFAGTSHNRDGYRAVTFES